MNDIADPLRRLARADLGLLGEPADASPPSGHQHVLHNAGAMGNRAVVDAGLNSQPIDLYDLPAVTARVEQSSLNAGRGDARARTVRDQGRQRHAERASD